MGEDFVETNSQGKMVRASDSWLSGAKGGKPGIIMPGNPHPKPGDAYRQEYYPGRRGARPGTGAERLRAAPGVATIG